MNRARAHPVVPAAVRVETRPGAKRRAATSEFTFRERSRGVERAVLGSVLLVFLAVAVPQYASYRRMAADLTARSSIREAIVALESHANGSGRGYAGADARTLERQGARLGTSQWLLVVSVPDSYWVLAQARGASGLWVRSSEDSGDRLIAAK